MKKNRLFRLLALLSICFLTTNLQSQVTIGSNLEPNLGALLDFKEKTPGIDNLTSDKGVLLPRVSLTDLKKLQIGIGPEFIGDEKIKHVGLTVYNLTENYSGIPSYLKKGIYTWQGDRWEYMGSDPSYYDPVNKYLIDHEGNRYSTADFGEAGVWMTVNLRVRSIDPVRTSGGVPTAVLSGPSATGFPWAYPGPDGSDDADPTTFNADPRIGLLYSWYSASLREAGGAYQGICPRGWHLPSYVSYNALVTEITNNMEKYSISTGVGAGAAMKAPQELYTGDENKGTSKFPEDGGFFALLAGLRNHTEGSSYNFGKVGYFWTPGYPTGFPGGLYVSLQHNDASLYSGNNARADKRQLMSVRCRKDQ